MIVNFSLFVDAWSLGGPDKVESMAVIDSTIVQSLVCQSIASGCITRKKFCLDEKL